MFRFIVLVFKTYNDRLLTLSIRDPQAEAHGERDGAFAERAASMAQV